MQPLPADPDRMTVLMERAARLLAEAKRPVIVQVVVARDLTVAGPDKTGWWDAPSPAYDHERHARWQAGVAEEQHQ